MEGKKGLHDSDSRFNILNQLLFDLISKVQKFSVHFLNSSEMNQLGFVAMHSSSFPFNMKDLLQTSHCERDILISAHLTNTLY